MNKLFKNAFITMSLILSTSCQMATPTPSSSPSSSNPVTPTQSFSFVGIDGDKTQKDFDIAKPDGEKDLHFSFSYDFGKETDVKEIAISRIGSDGQLSLEPGWSTNAAHNFWILYLESEGKFIVSRNESSFKLSGVKKIDAYGSGKAELSAKGSEFQLDIIDTMDKKVSLKLKI